MMTLLQKQVLFILFTALWMKGKPAVLNCFFWQASLRSHETKPLEKNFAANKILSGKTE